MSFLLLFAIYNPRQENSINFKIPKPKAYGLFAKNKPAINAKRNIKKSGEEKNEKSCLLRRKNETINNNAIKISETYRMGERQSTRIPFTNEKDGQKCLPSCMGIVKIKSRKRAFSKVFTSF